MPEASRPEPPRLVVAGAPDSPLVRAVLAGIEEEGVPSYVRPPTGREVGAEARAAALASSLQVGVAVTDESICLTHAKFAEGSVVELARTADADDARRIGHTAARIVVGLPLRAGRPDQVSPGGRQ